MKIYFIICGIMLAIGIVSYFSAWVLEKKYKSRMQDLADNDDSFDYDRFGYDRKED